MNSQQDKIPVGVSSCLIGHHVRYDGGHKNNTYINETLGLYFNFIPFCPEVASGMSTPRAAIQLRYTDNGIRCVGVKDPSLDVTKQLNDCASNQDHWLLDLCGYILKKDSPSCGMQRVKIYKNDYPHREGIGLFAHYVQNRFPLLPLEEEGRLGDPKLRENFIQRVFVMKRWQELKANHVSKNSLMTFHSQHKLICMSHDQNDARVLGRLIANVDEHNLAETTEQYGQMLMTCLKKIASRGNHVNVLQHIQGYLKKQLDNNDKAELIETIENYRLGFIPLIVPITLLRHHFRKSPDPFIDRSYYMNPYPDKLTVLNNI